MTSVKEQDTAAGRSCMELLLLSNAYDPDPCADREALALIRMRCRVKLLAWDRRYLKMFWKAWRYLFDALFCYNLDTLPLGFMEGKLKRKPIAVGEKPRQHLVQPVEVR